MKRADRELIGQAILGIPGHITKAYDSYKEGQNTRFNQQVQLAQAQVAAEKARQEMKYLPEEYKNKAEEIRLRGEEFGQKKREWEQKPARDREDFLQKGVGKIADALDTPETIIQALGLPPGALNDPETLAKVTELAKQSRGTQLNQKITESRLTTRARQGEMTTGAANRFKYKEGQVAQSKASPQITSVLKGTETFLKRALDKELTDGEVVPELKRQLNVVRDIVMKKQQNGEPVTSGDMQAVQRLELEIQSRGGGAPRPTAPSAPVQQYQQPIGPMPNQQIVDPIDSLGDDDLLKLHSSLKMSP